MLLSIDNSKSYSGYFKSEDTDDVLDVKYRVRYTHDDREITLSQQRVTESGYFSFDLADQDILGFTNQVNLGDEVSVCVVDKTTGFIVVKSFLVTEDDTVVSIIKIPTIIGNLIIKER